jgi:hypothetical protein
MPRYLIKFEDGTQEQFGAPGRDSDKIRQTVTAQAERKKGKKVVGIQPVASNGKSKKVTSKAQPNAKKAKAPAKKTVASRTLTLKKASGRGKTTAKGKIKVTNSKKRAPLDGSSLKIQITTLENTLSSVVQDLTYQIRDLKASILLAKRQELISQLDDIESQL